MAKITRKKKMKFLILTILAVFIGFASFEIVSAQQFGNSIPQSFSGGSYTVIGSSVNPQFTAPGFFSTSGFTSPEVYWPKFNKEQCLERQDFIMQIAPGGCSPAVVTSDLLEEQNVPVFCKVMAIQVNPLIDVSKVRSLRFTKQNYPKGVSSISYFPARTALRSQTSLVSSPVDDNLGYLVVVLSKNEIEKDMPDFVEGNVTATIDYDAEGAFGIGNTNFYIPELNEQDWAINYKQYGFWNGKGYIRADSIEPDQATISIYRDVDTKQDTVTLKKGETSGDIYLSGFYCAAGMNIKLEKIDEPVDSALLQINDQQVWVAKGDKIADGKCSVTSLDTYGGGGKISISCPVKSGRFELSLTPGKVKLKVNGQEKDYAIGNKIQVPQDNIFVGYVGEAKDGKFVVLVNDSSSASETGFASKGVYGAVQEIMEKEGNTDKKVEDLQKEIKNKIINKYGGKTKLDEKNIEIVQEGKSGFEVQLVEASIVKDIDLDAQNIPGKEYYKEAIKNYEELVELYPNEKVIQGEKFESYAAQGLFEAAQLSRKFEMNEKANELYDRLLKEYPNSYFKNKAEIEKDLLMRYDTSKSKAVVLMQNSQYFIDLLNFKKPTKDDMSVVLSVGGQEKTFSNGEIEEITSGTDANKKIVGTIQIKEIKEDYVSIKYEAVATVSATSRSSTSTVSGNFNSRTEKLELKEENRQADFGGVNVRLLNINLKKQLKVYITPKAFGPRTQSVFNFKIGIEKRDIKLSPEKTREMIKNIGDTLEKWNDINEKLGKVVKGLKGACFATSAVLTVKNLLSGFSGESMARGELMTRSGGWNDKCEEIVNSGSASKFNGNTYTSVQSCLVGHNDLINRDVQVYSKQIQETNKILEGIQNNIVPTKSDILDFQGQVDSQKVDVAFEEEFKKACLSFQGQIELPDKTQQSLSGESGICNWDSMSLNQRREILTLYNARQQTGGSDVLKGFTNSELSRIVLDAKNYNDLVGARKAADDEAKKSELKIKRTDFSGDKKTSAFIETWSKPGTNLEPNSKVIRVFIDPTISGSKETPEILASKNIANRDILIKLNLDKAGSGVYTPAGYYTLDGTEIKQSGNPAKPGDYEYIATLLTQKEANKFIQSDAKAYQNAMLYPETLQVKYFERAPYKKFPAEVPFDIQNGWYVEMTYVLSGFGQPYDESGRVVNYYICNVGANGLIEFKKSADDICRYYNGNSADLNFPGMSESDSRKLISRAQDAIREAARQYGSKNVVINGQSFKAGTSFGGEGGRCSDFMPPSDCNILFNVCDPVICPASRCDLGGAYRVDNVIQSGIIGSLMLCLPNAQEGILVPICLSGVHAGIEGYLSILNSTQKCLNESLETGRNIGICDEIKSVYLCKFFWKQATPFLNVLIPRLIENLYSQGVRGGGEYLTVQTAWDNTEKSIEYFTNDYAINSMQAFTARSTESIGDDICKSYVSLRVPDSSNFFDTLIEPDSPVQYSAWFSEDVLTTATLPSTSHYKVYYHIYSGKDQGAYYSVYLKDLPEIGYIHSSQVYIVDTNYIARGSQVDEARDFTAVSGYRQLCISVNGQEQCDFGKVSTSYFINSLSDEYAKQQSEQTSIRSEKQCIAGTSSAVSLLQPNIQAGAEEFIEPELYNQGIIRVCATENPGKQVTPTREYDRTKLTYDRWKEVGYCDDPTIKCWLDTQSVKNAIKNKGITQEVMDKVDLNILGEQTIINEDDSINRGNEADKFIDSSAFAAQLKDAGGDTNSIEAAIISQVEKLKKLSEFGVDNKHRARAFYLLGKLYKKVAESFLQASAGTSTGGILTKVSQEPIVAGSVVKGASDLWKRRVDGTSDMNWYKVDSKDAVIDLNQEAWTFESILNVEKSVTYLGVSQTILEKETKAEGTKTETTEESWLIKVWDGVKGVFGIESIKGKVWEYNYNNQKIYFKYDDTRKTWLFSLDNKEWRSLSEAFLRNAQIQSFDTTDAEKGVEVLEKAGASILGEGDITTSMKQYMVSKLVEEYEIDEVDAGKIVDENYPLDLVEFEKIVERKGYAKRIEAIEETSEESGWVDAKLREDVDIKVLYKKSIVTTITTMYKYNLQQGWVSADDGIKGKNYVDGIKYIVDKTNSAFRDEIIIENTKIINVATLSDEAIEIKVFEALKK